MLKTGTKRLFVGVRIDPGEKMSRDYTLLREDLKEAVIKWVPNENLHLTLWFFGSVDIESIPLLIKIIEGISRSLFPFVIEIKSAGTFGKPKYPSVIWFGVEDTEGNMDRVYGLLRTQLEHAGYKADSQGFHPHLTLGRLKAPVAVTQVHEAVICRKDYTYQMTEVKELILYESIATKEGPVYKPVHIFPFVNSTK